MFRTICAIPTPLVVFFVAAMALASAAKAHEFWIEPEAMHMAEGDAMAPVLMIGEGLEGESYRFQPQAYAQALWTGPADQVDFSRMPLSGPKPSFRAFAPGLHSLAVTTFPQNLSYDSPEAFRTFLEEIGREDLWPKAKSQMAAASGISETYRRFAKTLVHFSDQTGVDRRVGLAREWVWQDGAFVLFDGAAPHPDQKAQVTCRTGPAPQAVTQIVMRTGEDGAIRPILPADGRCLINAVVMEQGAGPNRWKSAWVSLFLKVP